MTKFYAGIGSRETPLGVLQDMAGVAKELAEAGWVLRSGGATGADSAFEQGHYSAEGVVATPEIILPWWGYNKSENGVAIDALHVAPVYEARREAEKHHVCSFNALSPAVRKLHTRNVIVIRGREMRPEQHVKFVICWTKGGRDVGGTGLGIRVAKAYDIPVINMANKEWRQPLRYYMEMYGAELLRR